MEHTILCYIILFYAITYYVYIILYYMEPGIQDALAATRQLIEALELLEVLKPKKLTLGGSGFRGFGLGVWGFGGV